MKLGIIICALIATAGVPPAICAPVTTAEVDLLFRMGTPATEIAQEIQKRGLVEQLSAPLKAKFAAGGVPAPVLQRMQIATTPAAAPNAPPSPGMPSGRVKWPAVGEQYPPLNLTDPDGRPVNLNAFRGKVLLIELVGLPCAACQAFAGGDLVGEFKTKDSHGVQPNLGSIEVLFERFASGVRFEDERVVLIQLLLYGSHSTAPTLEQARRWRSHFSPAWKRKQPVIMVGTPEMIGPETYALIPGFHLVDQNFVLRYDAAGHAPKHNIYEQLLPAIPAMLAR